MDQGNAPLTVVTPVHQPDLEFLKQCAESIFGQDDPNWSWIIAVDGPQDDACVELLESFTSDNRVQVKFLERQSGISAATNLGVKSAVTSHIALLDQDDLLTADAIRTVREVIATYPAVDYVYTDEDKLDESGRLVSRFRKPMWSPERLRAQNYCCHLSVFKSDTFEKHSFDSAFDGAQDHEFLLRISSEIKHVVHIPKVLYHWRISDTSTSKDSSAKPAASSRAITAVERHLSSRGISADCSTNTAGYTTFASRRAVGWNPSVSIIIPTAGKRARICGSNQLLVKNCIQSLSSSSYKNFEVVLVHDLLNEQVLEELQVDGINLREVPYSRPFNFSEKTNLGVLHSDGDVIVFLNDDTQLISPDWLETFISYLSERDVGLVGPKLLLEDGRIQSAGHWNSFGAHHCGAGLNYDYPGPFGIFSIASERSGLTLACAATTRKTFEAVGGLSEQFPGAFNDVDFGNKLRSCGYRLIWTPAVEMFHFESLSRDPSTSPSEIRSIYRRWKTELDSADPYLPGLDLQIAGIDFSDAMVTQIPGTSPHHSELPQLGIV